MALCKFCNKWMDKGTGKREKEFCNNNCRSNFWYSKNKKKVDVLPPKKVYDSEKLPDDIRDEPLQFDKLEAVKDYDYFAFQLLNGACEEPEGHRKFIKEVNESNLSPTKKNDLIAASRIKQS